MLPFASVIIPTFRRPGQLAACLNAMTGLDYSRERFEVLVIDDGSPETLDAVVAPFLSSLPIRLIRQANRGPAAARNLGLQNACGELVAFTDDDCRPEPDWLLHLARVFEREPEVALGGAVVNSLSENIFAEASQFLINYLREYYQATGRNGFFTSNNLAFPARLLKQMSGFNEHFPLAAGEDREICDRWLRQGRKLVFVPDAVVSHSHNLSLSGFLRQHFNYGRGARHFHRHRGLTAGERLRIEPLSFYRDLMRYPLHVQKVTRAIPVTALFAVSQVANAAGFFWQAYKERLSRKARAESSALR